jgi:hypothetical protein
MDRFTRDEPAKEEGVPLLDAGTSYPVWSPYEAVEAAEVLQKLLAKEAD